MRGCAGPLDEMSFWRARFEVLGSLQAQLDTPHARSITAALRALSTDRNLMASFQSHSGELSRVGSCCARLTGCHTWAPRAETIWHPMTCSFYRLIHSSCYAQKACTIAWPEVQSHST